MHNLHLVVVKADNAKDACNLVEDYISDFGNENNWRTICGCVSKSNKVYNTSDGRFEPSTEGLTTIAKINKYANGLLKGTIYAHSATEKIKQCNGKINLKEWTSNELFSLERLAQHEYQCINFRDKKINVLKDEFYAYSYDECGITQMGDSEGRGTFVVFIDMHS